MDDVLAQLKTALAERYVVDREIGRGGMATVYLAEELHPQRKVAIKVMSPHFATRTLRERFLREVNLTSKLTHPHIVPVFAAGEANDLLYFVMPYIEGESLRQRMTRRGPLDLVEAVDIAHEVAGALHYAHGFGVVHRDVKPENILLTEDHALVADFGIARALGVMAGENLTQTGLAVGTPAYMSPEQADGAANVDARTDVYSLGCVLFEMLGGKRQGRPETRLTTMHDTVASVEGSTSTLSGLEATLRKALAVDPADRFVTADAFAQALKNLQRQGPPVTPERRAVRLGALVGAAVIAVALVVGLFLPKGGDAATPERVVVALYENQTGDADLAHLGPMATDWITQGLAQTGLLNVVVARSGLAARDRVPNRPIANRIHRLVDETGAEMVVSGAYYRQGDQLQFQTRITDPEGQILLGLSPVVTPLDSPLVAVELLRQRVMGALASLVDERLRPAARAISEPPSYEAYQQYVEGWTQFVRLNQVAAIERFLRAAELDSSFVTARLMAAFAYATMEEWHQSDSLARIVAQSREVLAPLERHQLDWIVRMSEGDLAGAMVAIRSAAEVSGPETLIFVALNAIWTNRPDEAIAALERLDPESGFASDFFLYWDLLTGSLHVVGRHEDELEQARRGRAQYPSLRTTVASELRALYTLGETESVDSLWDLYESLPTMPAAFLQSVGDLGRMAAMEAQTHGRDSLAAVTLARSIGWYRSLARSTWELEEHRYGLARTLYVAGEYREARPLFERLFTEHPDSLGYEGYLGSVAARLGDREEALRISESLEQQRRQYDFGGVPFWRARIASVLGDREEAMGHLRMAESEGYHFDGEERFIADLQGMHDFAPFVEWVRPRG